MGIKNIHILLISCSVLVAVFFGLWSLSHAFKALGVCSLVIAVGLFFYGINFIKTTRVM